MLLGTLSGPWLLLLSGPSLLYAAQAERSEMLGSTKPFCHAVPLQESPKFTRKLLSQINYFLLKVFLSLCVSDGKAGNSILEAEKKEIMLISNNIFSKYTVNNNLKSKSPAYSTCSFRENHWEKLVHY